MPAQTAHWKESDTDIWNGHSVHGVIGDQFGYRHSLATLALAEICKRITTRKLKAWRPRADCLAGRPGNREKIEEVERADSFRRHSLRWMEVHGGHDDRPTSA